VKTGNRVIVNHNNYAFADFFDATGTIIGEFTNQIGDRKLVVHFDNPIIIEGVYDPIFKDMDTIVETYDFFEDCLEMLVG
jgi:hypothetical protein